MNSQIQKQTRREASHRAAGGYLIVECLVYSLVLLILLAVAFAAMYRCVENSVALRRNSEDIVKALQIGERWRADVRSASDVNYEKDASDWYLRLEGPRGEVIYRYTTNSVLRRVGTTSWSCLLANVKTSEVRTDSRKSVTVWRWELELQPRTKKPVRTRPMFTFLAVPQRTLEP